MNNMEFMEVETARNRIPVLENLVRNSPNDPLRLADLGCCYFTVGETEKAFLCCREAWTRCKNGFIGTNLAIILKDLGRHEEAFRVIEEAYYLMPENDYTRLAYAEALLRAGFWLQAWPLYDHARPTQRAAADDVGVESGVQEWDGNPLPKNHLLLVINEGGSGDRLNYSRWLQNLTKMGINWVFYPYAPLHSLYEPFFGDRLLKDGDTVEPTHWTTTFSLPCKLKATPATIPPPLPYRSKYIENYRFDRKDNLPIVGICYEAAEKNQGGRKVRSMSEGQAMRIVCSTADKIHWVNLQHGRKMPYPVSNIDFDGWEQTTGLIHNLDAVVSVDTAIFWLASSIGKPTHLVLSGNSDWKFLSKGSKCHWSKSVRMYRNNGRGFEQAIDSLIRTLRQSGIFI